MVSGKDSGQLVSEAFPAAGGVGLDGFFLRHQDQEHQDHSVDATDGTDDDSEVDPHVGPTKMADGERAGDDSSETRKQRDEANEHSDSPCPPDTFELGHLR